MGKPREGLECLGKRPYSGRRVVAARSWPAQLPHPSRQHFKLVPAHCVPANTDEVTAQNLVGLQCQYKYKYSSGPPRCLPPP